MKAPNSVNKCCPIFQTCVEQPLSSSAKNKRTKVRSEPVKGEIKWVIMPRGSSIHVLTGWNHELLNWAKHQIFQGLPRNTCNFYSNRLSRSESLSNQSYSTKISFLHEDQSEFFINNIHKYALLSLNPLTFVPYWDTIWGCYPNPCSPNCTSKTLNNAFILFQFCLFSLLTSYCPRGRVFSLSPTKLSAYWNKYKSIFFRRI